MAIGLTCRLKAMRILALCSLVALLIATMSVPANCTMLELFRKHCPYSKFCNESSPTEEIYVGCEYGAETQPCCFDCHCDAACHTHGDCCPDIQIQAPTTAQECVPPFLHSSYFSSFDAAAGRIRKLRIEKTPQYRMFRECPEQFDDVAIVDKCHTDDTNVKDIDDHVVVSDSNGVTFKNKHCAFCHGVTEFIRWNIEVGFCASWESFGSSSTYTYNNCVLLFTPPLSDNIRIVDCLFSVFPVNCLSNEQGISQDVSDGCTDGPVMPFLYNTRLYKNVFCYYCDQGIDGKSDICPIPDFPLDTFSPPEYSLSPYMYPMDIQLSENDHGCGELEIYDAHVYKCRPLFCPPITLNSNGRCDTTVEFKWLEDVHLRIIFYNTSKSALVPRPVKAYGTTMQSSFVKRFKEAFKPCTAESLSATVSYKPGTGRLHFIEVTMVVKQNTACGAADIRRVIRQNSRITVPWYISACQTLSMEGRVTFLPGRISPKSGLLSGLVITRAPALQDTAGGNPLYVCPHVILGVEEYKMFARKSDSTPLNNTATDNLHLIQHQLDGFYFLSDDEVAACIDVYLDEITRNSADSMFSFILVYGVMLVWAVDC